MDASESPREQQIREEARAWLAERWPAFKAAHGEPPYDLETARAWQRELHAGGWGAPHWPAEYGGRGFGPVEAVVWADEKARAGANVVFNIVGFGMAGPTIISHGTEAQKQRYLEPLLRGDEIWCQLFSEPGAGSDLAAVKTRAERDGDGWVVTGQKVWSSGADEADFGILLARHDFDAPKHKGLVYLVVDMRAPGVEVRPLRQISGEAHFSEVFLENVRVPDGDRIGEPGDGWTVAKTTLMHERISLGQATGGFTFPFEKLVEIARARGRADALTRQALARVYMQEKILDGLNKRMIAKLRKGQIPSEEASIMKLALSNLGTDAADLGVALLGAQGVVLGDEGPQRAFLWERAMHIGGGTDEVQRNAIAERVLGLPREPSADRDVPFSRTRTS